jgi:hypothetical protein
MAWQFSDLLTRWRNRKAPLACPSTPDCPGTPTKPLARFALANETLRCTACGKSALALQWRTVGEVRRGGVSPG